VQVTTIVLSTDLVGKQAWRCFGDIIRGEVRAFHPCIAMPNLQGVPPFPERKNCSRQVRGGDTRDYAPIVIEHHHQLARQYFLLCFLRTLGVNLKIATDDMANVHLVLQNPE
jgi:hypothetical protein